MFSFVGNEKDLFVPRILHQTREVLAQNGQLDPIMIPCAAQAQPQATYKWYWIPFTVIDDLNYRTMSTLHANNDFNWETEIVNMILRQSSSSSSSGATSGHTSSQPIPISLDISESSASNGISHGRIKNLGSTLYIPGPIEQKDSGHYVALVSNSIGQDKCVSTVYVRTPLTVRLEMVLADDQLADTTRPSTRSQFKVVRGHRVRFRCTVTGSPTTDVYWLHNTAPIDSAHKLVSPVVRDSESGDRQGSATGTASRHSDISAIRHLELLLDDPKQSGMYQCLARNRFEVAQGTIELLVIGKLLFAS